MKSRSITKPLAFLLVAVLCISLIPISVAVSAAGEVIEIDTPDELMEQIVLSANGKNFEGDTIRLTSDITLTDADYQKLQTTYANLGLATFTFNIDEEYPFKGVFDGNGHTITGLRYDIDGTSASSEADTGLFAFAQNATIKDLIIRDAVIDADCRAGILVGRAEGCTIENVSLYNSKLTMYCYNPVLTLVTDGGMTAGVLAGEVCDCTIRNCEANGCEVRTNVTSGVEALSGKGFYLGALIGDVHSSTVEYCRVQAYNGKDSSLSIHYDVAVGALGGITAYGGGLIGELQAGSKVIDSFSTADMDAYTATYVSVGGGNSCHVGGIVAAVQGKACEITRCHYAGNATTKQYNAILVIPIIQKDKNISGIAAKFSGGSVTDSYFKYEMNPDAEMETLGDNKTTSEYGPQSDATYADHSFWENHDYDFVGNKVRESGNINKWVMDTELGIPVHGYSVAATFDFPGAGSLIISKTDLASGAATTTNPLEPAFQGFRPLEDTISINLSLSEDYRIANWYLYRDFVGRSFDSYDALERYKQTELVSDGNFAINAGKTELNISGDVEADVNALQDNDLYIANVQANVVFVDTDGATELDNNWYDYQDPLPEVTPTAPNASATFLGWTTDKVYTAITAAELSALKATGDFYETADPVEKPMTLYPVFADLISNVEVAIEGHGGISTTRSDGELLVGNVAVHQDADGRFYIELTDFAGESNGYRFLGWYTGCGAGNAYPGGVRASDATKFYLDDYDLTQYDASSPLLFVAKMEYLVDYHPYVKNWVSNEGVLIDPCASIWHTYGQTLVEAQPPMDAQDTFKHWGYNPWENTGNCNCSNDVVASGKAIIKPLDVYSHQYGTSSFDIVFESDFPESGVINHTMTGTLGLGKLTLTMVPNSGYRFLAWIGERKQTPKWQTWTPETTYYDDYFGGSYFKFIALMDAQINFYTKDDSIKSTVYRRHEEKIFSGEEQKYNYQYPFSTDSVGLTVDGKDVTSGEHISYPSLGVKEASMNVDGYFFLGWISDAEVEKSGTEWNHIYDVEDLYCTSDADNALPYIMDGTELCYEAQNLYPVYIKNATVETTTNQHLNGVTADDPYVNLPSIPEYIPGEVNPTNGNIAGKITAKTNTEQVLKNSTDTTPYKLISVDVYIDGKHVGTMKDAGSYNFGGQTFTATGDDTSFDIDFTVVPNHDYYFVANYEPLVVVYHTNETTTQSFVRNTGDALGEQPQPDIPERHVFKGWTTQSPTSGWYVTDPDAGITDATMIISHSMELWPVLIEMNINVDSNLEDAPGLSWEPLDQERGAQLNVNDVPGYEFLGWYVDWDGTTGTKIADNLTHNLYGDDVINGETYWAIFSTCYTIYYHGTDGEIIETVEVLLDDTRSFMQTGVDDEGNTVTLLVDAEALLAIMESLTDNELFREWYWLRGTEVVHWEQFCNKSVVQSMTEAAVTEMHLYPITTRVEVLDAQNESILDDVVLRFVGSTINVNLNVPAVDKAGASVVDQNEAPLYWYAQPRLTVNVQEITYGKNGVATTTKDDSISNVSLYHAVQDQTAYLTQTPDANGTVVFQLSGTVTIKKVLEGDNESTEPFLFQILDANGNHVKTIPVQANSTVTLQLPCGYYSVQELTDWNWRYTVADVKEIDDQHAYDVSVSEGFVADITLSVGRDGNADGSVDLQWTNRRSNLQWFTGQHQNTNVFGTVTTTNEGEKAD